MAAWNIDDLRFRNQGEPYHRLFDLLNLDEKTDRRIGVFILEEYYKRLMSEIGREYLGFSDASKEASLGVLWRKTLDRFELMDSFDEPDEYTSYIRQLHHFRNQTAHNSDYNPPQSNLQELRDEGSDWLEWFIETAHHYDAEHEQIPPRELMISMTRRSLEKILSESDTIEPLNEELEGIHRKAEQLQNELIYLEENEDEISADLIDVLVDAIEIARDLEELQQMEEAFWFQVEAEIEERRIQRHLDDE